MTKKIKSKLNQQGFSLIELMVVIVIMLILAGIAIPAFMGVVADAREAKASSEVRTVLMLAQLAVNKDADKAAEITDDLSATYEIDGETIDSILTQAGIIDSKEFTKYAATLDGNKVSITYTDASLPDGKITLPDDGKDD